MWQNKYVASIAIFLTELAVICLLVPVRIVEGAISEEYEMSVKSLGIERADEVYDSAKKDYESLIIESGLYTAVVRHLIPTDEERRNSGKESCRGRCKTGYSQCLGIPHERRPLRCKD